MLLSFYYYFFFLNVSLSDFLHLNLQIFKYKTVLGILFYDLSWQWTFFILWINILQILQTRKHVCTVCVDWLCLRPFLTQEKPYFLVSLFLTRWRVSVQHPSHSTYVPLSLAPVALSLPHALPRSTSWLWESHFISVCLLFSGGDRYREDRWVFWHGEC